MTAEAHNPLMCKIEGTSVWTSIGHQFELQFEHWLEGTSVWTSIGHQFELQLEHQLDINLNFSLNISLKEHQFGHQLDINLNFSLNISWTSAHWFLIVFKLFSLSSPINGHALDLKHKY